MLAEPSPNALKDALRFLRVLLAHPRQIGAIAPSSSGLARAMAAQIDISQSGSILELGPGTGALTRGILARGIAPERLTLIEYDPTLAKSLAADFAGACVICADAFDLSKALQDRASEPFIAAVSGIPLLNFPRLMRDRLLHSVFERLAPGAPFIQFSYGLHPPIASTADISADRAATIWLNLPPARVWVYRRG
jgi:phosphatidylethanolamine/phosphatidyl-N-methylethanolamine N-methyltransferase